MKNLEENMLSILDEFDVKPLDKHNVELLDKVHPAKCQFHKHTISFI